MKALALKCESGPTWDIMLSYRREKYASICSLLADLATDAGLRCWLDLRNIDQHTALSTEKLQSTLRDAVEHSRIVVGFLDEDILLRDASTGKTETFFSWRLYEHQFAREFVWMSGSFLYSFPDERIPVYNPAHLVYYLALACDRRTSLEQFWNKHLSGLNSAVRHGIYLVAKYHEMPVDFLPAILHPRLPDARRNAMHADVVRRQEIVAGHNFDVFK